MLQLCISRLGNQNHERPDLRVGQNKTSIQERREKRIRNTRLRAHLCNTTVLPVLTYASETWAFCKQEESAISVIEREIEMVMLGVTRFTQVKERFEVHSYVTDRRSKTLPHMPRRAKLGASGRDAFQRQSLDQSRRRLDTMRHQTHHRKTDGQTSSQSPSKKSTTLFESLARRDAAGQHLRAIGRNGSITGALSSKSMNNGSIYDTGYAGGVKALVGRIRIC
ncbi:hypothetical protein RB195_014398 [Necator americanus]|uniref:Uncharacterized protein n=1 Tax=Necator americanus TaxID=51031 RepID=A0ABR1E2M7_NECAM